MALLKCENLTIGYEGRPVIKDLSFSVEAGDYLVILGENGAGKTTLMKTLLGLHSKTSGEIITGDGLLKGEIGYLPQQTEVQRDFPASVREIVMSGCSVRRGFRFFYSEADRRRAADNMERMGITDIADRCYRDLSGGQQQRALLARALCAAEKMLILDEPAAGLDPAATFELYKLIERLNKEDKITIVMVSHDIKAAYDYADHILHIGEKVFFGTKQDYFASGAVETGAKTSAELAVKSGADRMSEEGGQRI